MGYEALVGIENLYIHQTCPLDLTCRQEINTEFGNDGYFRFQLGRAQQELVTEIKTSAAHVESLVCLQKGR